MPGTRCWTCLRGSAGLSAETLQQAEGGEFDGDPPDHCELDVDGTMFTNKEGHWTREGLVDPRKRWKRAGLDEGILSLCLPILVCMENPDKKNK